MLEIAAISLVITAVLAYLNHRFVGLPTAIGVMAAALVLSLALVGLDAIGVAHSLRRNEESFLRSIDFSDVLMQGMLSLLLFAGALHVDLSALKTHRLPVAGLAVLGTLASTLLVGYGMWFAAPFAGVQLPFIYCLLFGALISPTDPIAVMGILKSAKAPEELELVIVGESPFNDGVAVVIFGLPFGLLQPVLNLPRGSWKVLTWGGLRGGISVALALSLPAGSERDVVVALTYCVVVFSILMQGLSIGFVTRKAVVPRGAGKQDRE